MADLLNEQTEGMRKLERENSEKEKSIRKLNTNNQKLNSEIYELTQRFTNLNSEYSNFKNLYENILNENESLKNIKINLDNEIREQNQKNSQSEFLVDKLESDLRTKEDHLNFFKENVELMKSKQEEILQGVDHLLKENEFLKNDLDEKKENFANLKSENEELKLINNDMKMNINELNNLIDELKVRNEQLRQDMTMNNQENIDDLLNKIENLKLEFQYKEESYQLLKEANERMTHQIENVFKIKIKALKSKLKEKMEILALKDRELEESKKKSSNRV
jgi:chromosome segregation ATPase